MVMVLFLVAQPLIKLVCLHVIMCVAFQLIQNFFKETALFGTCRCGHAETAKVLLDHGAIVDYQDVVRVKK